MAETVEVIKVEDNSQLGTLELSGNTVSAEPASLADLMNRFKDSGSSEIEAFHILAEGWSNGWVRTEKRANG